jgi:CTP synthase
LGGTMRLGAQSSDVAKGTLAHGIYGDVVTERHRHRYEANVQYLDTAACSRSGHFGPDAAEHLTEIIELPQPHPWFVGVQFHPEFKSTPWNGHPLFNAFVKAALDNKAQSGKKHSGRSILEGAARLKMCDFSIKCGIHSPLAAYS